MKVKTNYENRKKVNVRKWSHKWNKSRMKWIFCFDDDVTRFQIVYFVSLCPTANRVTEIVGLTNIGVGFDSPLDPQSEAESQLDRADDQLGGNCDDSDDDDDSDDNKDLPPNRHGDCG